ncbi:protein DETOXIFICATION 20-like [Tasmannia lanceolata]|uniref:protein DETOXIFICATION 20-like n=1 Tax=Tasmannia lanceolata TaxID=3420 RepID=UPI004062BEF9
METGSMEDKLLGSREEEEGGDLKRRFFTESGKLWRVAAPSILIRISSFGMLVVTQSFIGHNSELELAAYALVQTFLLRFANGVLLGMASALETLCGQAYGARQYHMLGIYLQRWWIVLTATATLMLPIYIFATPILKLLGQDTKIAEASQVISLWLIPIIFYFVFYFTLQMFLQAQQKNTIIAWLASTSFALQILLQWVAVYKLNLGISGAMGSMVLANWLILIAEFMYVFGGWCPKTWRGFSKSAFYDLWPVVKLSLSSGVMLCVELWYNSVLILVVGYMKNAEVSLSAFSICLSITTWELMLHVGFLSATCVRVANELGRGDAKAAKFAISVVSSTSLAIGVVFFVLFLVFGKAISYVFTSSEEVAEEVSSLRVYVAFSVLLNSIQPVLSGVALGAGWQSIVAYINIGCYYVIGIPLGLLLGYLTSLQVRGIWIGMICGIAAQTFVLICITQRTDWDLQVEKAKARLDRWLLPDTNESDGNTTSHA